LTPNRTHHTGSTGLARSLRKLLRTAVPQDICIHNHPALFVAPMAVSSSTRKLAPVGIVSNIAAASRVFCRDSLCLVLHLSSLSRCLQQVALTTSLTDLSQPACD